MTAPSDAIPPLPDLSEVPVTRLADTPCCGNCSGWVPSAKDPRQGLCLARPPTPIVALWRLRADQLVPGATLMEPVREAAIFPPMAATGRCRDGWKPAGKPDGETSH